MEKLATNVPFVVVAIIQFTFSRGIFKGFPPGLLAERFLECEYYQTGCHQGG